VHRQSNLKTKETDVVMILTDVITIRLTLIDLFEILHGTIIKGRMHMKKMIVIASAAALMVLLIIAYVLYSE
jgi:hypothetical protein